MGDCEVVVLLMTAGLSRTAVRLRTSTALSLFCVSGSLVGDQRERVRPAWPRARSAVGRGESKVQLHSLVGATDTTDTTAPARPPLACTDCAS